MLAVWQLELNVFAYSACPKNENSAQPTATSTLTVHAVLQQSPAATNERTAKLEGVYPSVSIRRLQRAGRAKQCRGATFSGDTARLYASPGALAIRELWRAKNPTSPEYPTSPVLCRMGLPGLDVAFFHGPRRTGDGPSRVFDQVAGPAASQLGADVLPVLFVEEGVAEPI